MAASVSPINTRNQNVMSSLYLHGLTCVCFIIRGQGGRETHRPVRNLHTKPNPTKCCKECAGAQVSPTATVEPEPRGSTAHQLIRELALA